MFLSVCLSTPAAWAYDYDFKADGIYYNITSSDDKTVEVTTGNYSGDVTIPATVTYGDVEYRVTAIGEETFRRCHNLTSVTIGDGVTTIGEWAFDNCYDLTEVTIPESVQTIGDYAFNGCSSLTSVTIGDGVTTIGDYAFNGCSSLTSVTIPESVTFIGDRAFSYCDGLTSVTIPERVTAIGDGAFSGCSDLTEFKGKFASDNGRCLIVNDTLKSFAPSGLPQYTIPDEVKVIGGRAFSSCSSLTSVTIGESVTAIGDEAFRDCSGLTSVTIGEGVTTIGDGAFSFCSGLTSVTIGNSVTTIGSSAFAYCENLTEVTIGDGVTTIGDLAFRNCDGLTSVTIPESVTAIGDYAFTDCSGLTSVTIPESVQVIGDDAFYGCSGLKNFEGKIATADHRCLVINDTLKAFAPSGLTQYTIPKEVKVIGGHAFSGCDGLTSVTIGKNVQTIGEDAFWQCTGLTSVTAYNPTPVAYYFYNDVNCTNCTLYVPAESVELYKAAEGWSEFGEILPIVAYDFEAAPTITPVENDETITALSTFTLTFDERPALVGDSAAVMKTDSSAYYPASITASEDGKSFIITLQGDEQTKAAEYSLTEAGTYLLVIPAGTFGDDVFAADPKTGHSNPELVYTYTIKAPEPVEPDEPDDPSSITETQADTGHITVYNLQGVPVLETNDAADLKTLQNGAYIVNGKKMIIAR